MCEHSIERNQCKECDPTGHLIHIVRSRIRGALQNDKTKHSIEYLNCDIEDFKLYIEEKFKPGMTWENHGKVWHIGHIVPTEVPSYRKWYCSPSNYQPLWTTENIAKGNRYVG